MCACVNDDRRVVVETLTRALAQHKRQQQAHETIAQGTAHTSRASYCCYCFYCDGGRDSGNVVYSYVSGLCGARMRGNGCLALNEEEERLQQLLSEIRAHVAQEMERARDSTALQESHRVMQVRRSSGCQSLLPRGCFV